MIEALQINPVIYHPSEGEEVIRPLGYYQDPVTGGWRYRYTDVYGRIVVLEYDSSTGLWYPLAFDFWVPDEDVETAPSSKVLEVWPDDEIRINYSFKHKGPAESLTIEAGNCGYLGSIAGRQHYDKGSRNTSTKSVSEDLTAKTYTGSVDVVLESTNFPPFVTVFTYKHIYFLIEGKDKEFVMRDALKPYVGAIFEELEITNWQKV